MPALRSESATVLLVAPHGLDEPRPADGCDYRVLLLQRSLKASFMPGMYVFPGGITEEPLDAQLADEYNTSLLRVTAVRELFEEAGVLLAAPDRPLRSGFRRHLLDMTLPVLPAAKASTWRSKVNASPDAFADLAAAVEAAGGRMAFDTLAPWARWITPEFEPRRYDATFFVGALDAVDADALHCDRETIASKWMTPGEALAAAADGTLMLAPPQWLCLHEMATFTALEDLMEYAHAGRCIAPIMPNWCTTPDGTPYSALPGDADHSQHPGPSPGSRNRMYMRIRGGVSVVEMRVSTDLADGPAWIPDADRSSSPIVAAAQRAFANRVVVSPDNPDSPPPPVTSTQAKL
ncbi:NUDIX hydrolase [Thecamonas trahens ATCC 50062]|uniref:NUDIX hydrolase n=1 Tax=Thecamonas trahens ATCC 50062 TaxID=461836 RepID=A0A0L0DHF0_THETB|nr:NUDIX hydrolase [Thecamonas trahens ATCC 50062]KNC51789.1 NUDIX hydrolase [Thecamonas trahens ATCC 50062]|eukprot:XP_013755660.1 NUDIX hydrolase [Thecamonas trahens ATCC 50062]